MVKNLTKKLTFYYVRHGQTLFNQLGRMQGWCDSPLTAKGVDDAVEAREALKDVPINRAYASSAERCLDTAKIILEERDVEIIPLKGLKEMNFGTYEGSRIANHLSEIDPRRFRTYDWSDVGGENFEMLAKRVTETFEKICDECTDGDQILIVSHGTIFLHMLEFLFHTDRSYYLEIAKEGPKEYLPVPNGFVAIFTYDGQEYELQKLCKRDESLVKELNRRKNGSV